MTAVGRGAILCVDDEPQILDGLTIQLQRRYEVVTATSALDGLARILRGGIAVVLSDMRMPGMNGATFLARVRSAAPETVRMLLTGHADIRSAVAAVNDGQIFRFLTKPCPPDQLLAATAAAFEQHRLISAERELLEQTLHGSVRALTDMLALTNPAAFGRAARIKQTVTELCDQLDVRERWALEVAAMLSQLGCGTLPPQTAEKLYFGEAMTPDERAQVRNLPRVVAALLGHIPRLEPVLALLGVLDDDRTRTRCHGDAPEPHACQILMVAADLDVLESSGMTPQQALDTMRGRAGAYDARVLDALARCKHASARQEIRELPIRSVSVGMVFLDDVWTSQGMLLVARGYEATDGFVARAREFARGHVKEPVRVVVRQATEEAGSMPA